MSSGSNQVVTYQEVAAYQAEQGIATYTGDSGGYTTGGIYVSWTFPQGFTATDWFNDSSIPGQEFSPVSGMSQDDIQAAIEADNGTLNTIFANWVAKVGYEARYNWILDCVPYNCRYEVQ